ncbi:MAG: L-threonylcarbamoyladenylate synthase [Deltaproteobacteria bacterium]|nr:L-threonylcarbamoyladenylate synthase [Deltaproteobacteria bacterium]
MILKIHSQDPQQRLIEQVVQILRNDGVIIYKTDTTYVFGCSIHSKKGMKRIYQLKNIDKFKPLTFVCNNAQQFQQYTKGISTPIFRQIKSVVPGPYTFIFEASKMIPKIMLSPRQTIGVKIPADKVANKLVEMMDEPIMSSSIPVEDNIDFHDPNDLAVRYEKRVDCIIDEGEKFIINSAIIDFSVDPPQVIRSGDVDISWLESQ